MNCYTYTGPLGSQMGSFVKVYRLAELEPNRSRITHASWKEECSLSEVKSRLPMYFTKWNYVGPRIMGERLDLYRILYEIARNPTEQHLLSQKGKSNFASWYTFRSIYALVKSNYPDVVLPEGNFNAKYRLIQELPDYTRGYREVRILLLNVQPANRLTENSFRSTYRIGPRIRGELLQAMSRIRKAMIEDLQNTGSFVWPNVGTFRVTKRGISISACRQFRNLINEKPPKLELGRVNEVYKNVPYWSSTPIEDLSATRAFSKRLYPKDIFRGHAVLYMLHAILHKAFFTHQSVYFYNIGTFYRSTTNNKRVLRFTPARSNFWKTS